MSQVIKSFEFVDGTRNSKQLLCNSKQLLLNSTFIKCRLCTKPVHYNCNNPKVSAYYKKQCENFKCHFCKSK